MRTIAQDKVASKRTQALRVKHGGDAEKCPACCRAPEAPFRRDVADVIVAGCVDATHEGQIVEISSSGNWHYRPEARSIRQRMEVRP